MGEAGAVGVSDGLGAVAYAGLGENAIHVGLDGGLTDDEIAGDLGVRQTRRDQRQHLGFACGQAVGQLSGERGRRLWRTEPLQDAGLYGRVKHGLPSGNPVDGGGDLLRAGVLGEVATGTCLQSGEDGAVVGVGGEHDDLGVGVLRPDALRGFNAPGRRFTRLIPVAGFAAAAVSVTQFGFALAAAHDVHNTSAASTASWFHAINYADTIKLMLLAGFAAIVTATASTTMSRWLRVTGRILALLLVLGGLDFVADNPVFAGTLDLSLIALLIWAGGTARQLSRRSA